MISYYLVLLYNKLTTILKRLAFYIKLCNAFFIASVNYSYYLSSHINALVNVLYPGISDQGIIFYEIIVLTYLAHSSTKKQKFIDLCFIISFQVSSFSIELRTF